MCPHASTNSSSLGVGMSAIRRSYVESSNDTCDRRPWVSARGTSLAVRVFRPARSTIPGFPRLLSLHRLDCNIELGDGDLSAVSSDAHRERRRSLLIAFSRRASELSARTNSCVCRCSRAPLCSTIRCITPRCPGGPLPACRASWASCSISCRGRGTWSPSPAAAKPPTSCAHSRVSRR